MRSLFLILIWLLSNEVFGQDFTKWNVSVNASTSFSGILIAPAVNWETGTKTELSLMPVFRYYEGSSTYSTSNYGLQFSIKYYLSKENKMDPYISGLTGYLKEKSTNGNNEVNYFDYFTFGIFLGNEIQLGQKGWNFDFNVGLLNSQSLNSSSSLNVFPAYTLGLKKRFVKK